MPDMHQALARYRNLTVSLYEESPFSVHPLTAREREQVLVQAAEDAIKAGATYEDFQEVEAAYP
jgi:hypothetical protein